MKRIDSNKWSELVATGTDYLTELAEQGEHVEYAQFNDRVSETYRDRRTAGRRALRSRRCPRRPAAAGPRRPAAAGPRRVTSPPVGGPGFPLMPMSTSLWDGLGAHQADSLLCPMTCAAKLCSRYDESSRM